MQCAKMQGSTKAGIVLDPTTSHFANALQFNASASPAQILLISGESSIKESRQEDKRKKSSWIRRLKPQDEPELSKGGSAEASLETTYSERGNSCERMDVSSGSVQPGWFLQETAANGARARPNWQGENVSDAELLKMSKRKDCNGELRTDICQEKSTVIKPGKSMKLSAVSVPSNVGFGPWVNFSAGRKPDTTPYSVLGCKVIDSTNTTSAHEPSKDVQGSFHSAFSLTNSIPRCSPVSMVGDVTAPVILYKSPLSPVHSKLGLPPRPPSQKSPGFQPPSKFTPSDSGLGRGGFHQFAQDAQPSRQLSETPSNRESKQSVSVQDKDTIELAEAAVGRSKSSFQILKPSEQSFSDSMGVHGNGSSDCGQQLFAGMGNRNPPIRQAKPSVAERASAFIAIGQPLGTCADGAAIQFENGRSGVREDLLLNVSKEGPRGPICTNLPSVGMDLHLKVSVPGIEDPKPTLKNGSSSMEPNISSMQQSPSGSSHGTSTSEKADASASTSASLPWEMFIESAGASRQAREQFVEVYNRARDELKNQKTSQRMSRASVKEMDVGTKLTLGPGDTASDHRLKRQLLKREQHSAGHSQAHGRLNVPSTNSEHRSLSLASSSKEQHSTSLVESKGPITTLAHEQSGLQRDNVVLSKSDTPWKEADDFRLEQTRPEGRPRSSVKAVTQGGNQQIACQRLEERSVVHIEDISPADKGQIFSSTTAANTRELASTLYEGNGLGPIARLSHQLDDRKKSTSALGKRSHVTFEEHSISRVPEKSAVSRARPQSSPHVWLKRWHPTAAYNSKGLPDTQVPSDGKRSDSVSSLAFGLKTFKDGDGVGVFGRSKALKNFSVDKETGVKSLKPSPLKMLPSAAAMAIVGTAARQFCSAQPQRKGSFAFWSGFGMQPPRKVEPVQENGKAKMFLKGDVNMPNC